MSMLHLDGIRPAVNLLGDVEQHTALWGVDYPDFPIDISHNHSV